MKMLAYRIDTTLMCLSCAYHEAINSGAPHLFFSNIKAVIEPENTECQCVGCGSKIKSKEAIETGTKIESLISYWSAKCQSAKCQGESK